MKSRLPLFLLLLLCGLVARGQNQTCAGHKVMAFTASGSTTIISGVANRNIRLCKVDLATATAVGIKFVSIGSGGIDLTGVYANVTQLQHDFQGQPVGLGLGFGINLSGASVGGGTLNYYLTTGY